MCPHHVKAKINFADQQNTDGNVLITVSFLLVREINFCVFQHDVIKQLVLHIFDSVYFIDALRLIKGEREGET